MMDIKSSALELIGNTPLVSLDRIWPGPGKILGKCEFMNPGGAIKDRPAYGVIKTALDNGKLKLGQPVVEMTSGNMGTGLAVVCAVLGHPFTATMSKGNDPQRASMMRALGANVVLVDQVDGTPGNVTRADITAAEDKALDIVKETDAFFVNQFSNENNLKAHELTTGPEIWKQTGGKVDAFVAAIGTGGTFMGVTKHLKECNPLVKYFVVEPEGSQPIEGCEITKPRHVLQGSSYGTVPPLFNFETLEETISVSDMETVKYKRLLGKKEGLHVGYTSGGECSSCRETDEIGEVGWIR